jgi:hypothetical protein
VTGVELRVRHADPSPVLGLFGLLLLAYTFAGFGVYYLLTGSTTVGVGGRVTDLGGLIWFGPLFVGWLVMLLGVDRGPFRRLYLPRTRLLATGDGLAWRSPTTDGEAAWAEIGGVSSVGGGPGRLTTVYEPGGRPLAELRGEFEDVRTRDRRSVPERIVELHPDRFEPVDPARPADGCARREAGPSDDPARSAPSAR